MRKSQFEKVSKFRIILEKRLVQNKLCDNYCKKRHEDGRCLIFVVVVICSFL